MNKWLIGLLILGAASGVHGADRSDDGRVGDGHGPAETRGLMGEIYEGLRVVLPESVGREPFSDPDRQEEFAALLALLSDNAALLEQHFREEDREGRFLARSAARDAQELRRTFTQGRRERAGFLVRQIAENCIVCHSRLRDREERPLAAGLMQASELADLPLEEKAALQIATRRFDDALVSLERRLQEPDYPALMIGALTDYLVVAIRVKGDYERPIPVLRRFAARDDLWTALREDVEFWIESLPRLRDRVAGEPDFDVARALVEEARVLVPFPGSHRSLAHLVVASAVLERFVFAHGERDARSAEAYYLRGVIEAWIGHNIWVTAGPFMLETAIRMAPGEPFAREAYALLEQETIAAYEGAGEKVSPEERRNLEELHALVERAAN